MGNGVPGESFKLNGFGSEHPVFLQSGERHPRDGSRSGCHSEQLTDANTIQFQKLAQFGKLQVEQTHISLF